MSKIKLYYCPEDDNIFIINPDGTMEYKDATGYWCSDDDFYIFSDEEFIGEL